MRLSTLRNTLTRRAVVTSALALAVATVAGCVSDLQDPGNTAVQHRPIYNGQPDTAPEHMAVVALTYGPGTGYFCTGTLITQRVVLTAGHCLQGVQPGQLEIFFGNDVDLAGEYRAVQGKEVHPQYSNGQLLNDIGLLQLASDAPASVVPIRHLPSALELTAADVGVLTDFSGFGETENNTDGVKLHVAGPIGLVCPGPNHCTFNGADVNPATFAYDMGFGGPCFGDSGGPAFIFRAGCEYVAGITSYGDAACTDYGVNTKVDAHQAWIDGYIQSAGVEDCTAAGDEDADGVEGCADPDCACHPSCQTTPEECENGQDDDGDGLTDCDDHQCLTHPACQPQADASVPGPDGNPPSPDADTPTPDGSTPTPDGSMPTSDGGQPPDDAGSGPQDAGQPSAGSRSGCTCLLSGSPLPGLPWLFLWVALSALVRRFRRSR